MFKRLLPYFLLFTVSFVPRFISLGTIPTSLSHDEVDLIIQAHSVKLTGRDLSGSWAPWSLLPNDATMAELGPIINLPALSIFPNTLWSAHATTALLGTLYPLLIVILLLQWGLSPRVAWISGILLALSPWHILFSRTTLEQPTSLFFYTLSWLSLSSIFRASNKKTLILSTFSFLTCYLLGFYTYHGYKFALPLVTLIIALYHSYTHRAYKPLIFIGIIILALYLRVIYNSPYYSSRESEIIFLDSSRFAQVVDQDRRINLLSSTIQELFSNKPIAYLDLLFKKYLAVLSPDELFLTGEANGVFATGRTGYLYVFLIPFVLIGLGSILSIARSNHTLILILLTLSPLATVIHKNGTYAFRSAIFIVILTIVASIGIDRLSSNLPKFKVLSATVILLFVSFLHFLYVYFGYYPVESSRAYFFPDRVLATYLSHRGNEKILVIDPQPRYIMSYLALTNSVVTKATIQPLIGNYSIGEEKNIYQIGNLTIRRDCPDDSNTYTSLVVDATLEGGLSKCSALKNLPTPPTIHKIADPVDSGGNKIIYNDQVCLGIPLERYLNLSGTSSFALQDMSKVQFCSSWIIEN